MIYKRRSRLRRKHAKSKRRRRECLRKQRAVLSVVGKIMARRPKALEVHFERSVELTFDYQGLPCPTAREWVAEQ